MKTKTNFKFKNILILLFIAVMFISSSSVYFGALNVGSNYNLSEPTFTVTFNSTGANVVATPGTMEVAQFASLGTLPTQPEKDFSEFIGWNTEFDGSGEYYYSHTPITSDITLFAVWESKDYRLTAVSTVNMVQSSLGGQVTVGNKSFDETQEAFLDNGDAAAVVASPSERYKFVGWYTTLTGSTLVSAESVYIFDMPMGDVTYYARFELDYWTDHTSSPSGNGSVDNPYIINTAPQLAWVAQQTNLNTGWSLNKYIELNNNIDLNQYVWEPIGDNSSGAETDRFRGYFEGNGYVIENLYIRNVADPLLYSGLFGYVDGAHVIIQNLGIKNIDIKTEATFESHIGAIAGINNEGTIQNCFVYGGSIQGDINILEGDQDYYTYVGGLVGKNTYGTISNCYSTANVLAENNYNSEGILIGGLVGQNSHLGSIVENCYTTGTVTIVGTNDTTIKGNLVGSNDDESVIQNCFYRLDGGDTDYGASGVSAATENNVISLTTLQMQDENEYDLQAENWDFLGKWSIESTLNNSLPIIRGVGNMVLTSSINENSLEFGTLNIIGTNIYDYEDEVEFLFEPIEGYEIDYLKVNGNELYGYEGQQVEKVYRIANEVGFYNIEIGFRVETIRTPPSMLYVLIPLVITAFVIIFMVGARINRRNNMANRGMSAAVDEKMLERALKMSKDEDE